MATKSKRARTIIHVLVSGKTSKPKRINQVTPISDYSINSGLGLTLNQSSPTPTPAKEIFGLVNNHHRNRNRKTKHRNLFRIILLLLILLLLVGITIGVILLIPRNPTKTTINSSEFFNSYMSYSFLLI